MGEIIGAFGDLGGRPAGRPYGGRGLGGWYFDDGVEMVGHDDPFVELKFGAYLLGALPFMIHNFAQLIELHLTCCNVAEQALALINTGGDEIEAYAAVVMSR